MSEDQAEMSAKDAAHEGKLAGENKQLSPLELFISGRLEPQLSYFDAAAVKAKRWHQSLLSASLTATAAIPVANALTASVHASTILAAIAALSTGFLAMHNHSENAVRYRRTAEPLRALRARGEARLPPYDAQDGDTLFADDVEKVLAGERDEWTSLARNSRSEAEKAVKGVGAKAPVRKKTEDD